jgi:hypothetical protein
VVCIISALSITRLFKNPAFFIALVFVLFLSAARYNTGLKASIQDPVFSSSFLTSIKLTSVQNGELSLDYIDDVVVQTEAVQYIFNNYPGSIIAAPWPLVQNMTLIENSGFKQWANYNLTVIDSTDGNFGNATIIMYDSCCPPIGLSSELQNAQIVKSFDINQRHVFIYKIA